MRKLLASLCLAGGTLASAHELWVNAPSTLAADQTLEADLGYGHEFPTPEKIADDRLKIFKPLAVVGSKGSSDMTQEGENYHYRSGAKLEKGSYWISAVYQPSFWSKDKEGKWSQGDLKTVANAESCGQYEMLSKAPVIVDGGFDSEFFRKPIGQALEIVPQKDFSEFKAGELFPVQVLLKGEPLAGAKVTATSDEILKKDPEALHDEREPQIFAGTTDKNGVVNIIPLAGGTYKIFTKHSQPFSGDSSQCNESSWKATLILPLQK